MIILQMSGGLGNQMFQYAAYLKLKSIGREVKLDDVESYKLDNARPIQLTVFDISYPRATPEEVIELRDSSLALKDRIRRRLKGRNLKQYVEKDYSYDEHVLEVDDTYLIGYFQTDKYFKNIAGEVRECFSFREDLITEENRRLAEEIEGCEQAVSIHVRRGDYLQPGAADIFSGVCTEEYYSAAIEYTQKRFPEAVFFLFTNDLIWADFFVDAHPEADIRVVRVNSEFTGYLDMYLMTCCRHHILANSSFSWWGAWLAHDRKGITISPDVWFKNGHCKDIHTDDMIRIDEKGNLKVKAHDAEEQNY